MSARGSARNRYDSTVEVSQGLKRRLVSLKQITVQAPNLWPQLTAAIDGIRTNWQAIEDALTALNATKPPLD